MFKQTFVKEKLQQFRSELEYKDIPLNVFRKDFITFKKLCFLVLTNQVSIKDATNKASLMALNLRYK